LKKLSIVPGSIWFRDGTRCEEGMEAGLADWPRTVRENGHDQR